MIRSDRLDHPVLTVADIERTNAFYRDVLGLRGRHLEPAARR
jgi:catechol 2,3-dioxygenase-like lactoylglutathione lyase family enzyme